MGNPNLDDAFFELITASDRPDPQKLREVIARYPQFERELVQFSTAWAKDVLSPKKPNRSDGPTPG